MLVYMDIPWETYIFYSSIRPINLSKLLARELHENSDQFQRPNARPNTNFSTRIRHFKNNQPSLLILRQK